MKSLVSVEDTYAVLFERNPHPMIVYAPTGGDILAVNEAAVSTYGYSHEQFLRMNIRDISAPEELPRLEAHISRQRPSYEYSGVWRHVRSNGSIIAVEVNSSELPYSGRPARLISVNDVSRGVLAEEALRQSDANFRTLIRSAPLAIVTLDRNGLVQMWNPAAEHLFGWREAEVLHRPLLIVPENDIDEHHLLLARAAGGDPVVGIERTRRRKDGTGVLVSISVAALRDERGSTTGLIATYMEVGTWRTLEEQFRHAQKMESVGRLAGGVAHDFNNLLTVILGYGHMLRAMDTLDASVSSSVAEIVDAAERAADLTRQLLVFSRKQVLQPEVLTLDSIVRRMGRLLRRLIGEDIELVTVIPQSTHPVRVDPAQIEQVIANLVVNSRDAMPGGGRLTIEISDVELDETCVSRRMDFQPGKYVMLAVTDTGTGMDQAVQERIFEPFFTTKELGKGTGLGLAMVYGIIKQSGGDVWVYSEPGTGTTFKVYLPAVEAPGLSEAGAPELIPISGGSETILLVEDEEKVRMLAAGILKTAGYHVFQARTGDEALLILRQRPDEIHLLLTDAVLPMVSGEQLAKRAVEIRPGIRILFMSGYTDTAVVANGVITEGNVFLQKPFTPEILLRKTREALKR
ncbi:MAG: PAS domain S-box protein [Bryobacteraceae bacterium]|nr:PAS domain S-box protein [Bryobacterales bacterium]MEB2362321.1 PAS domain S-box protein [Bryobacterales bacterium]NUN02337.1 PAS domain S-box protein [Bryobacteraceae bacterium]